MKPMNELIENYLDESLTNEELQKLHAWLSEDVAHVKEFTMAIAREEQLRAAVKASEPRPTAVSRNEPRRVPWLRTTVGVITAASLAFVVWLATPTPKAAASLTLVHSQGDVSLRDENGHRVPVNAGDEFTSGAFLVDGFGAKARLTDQAGSSFSLSEDSELELVRGRGMTFRLHRGALIAELTEGDAGRPLTVKTPVAETTASGTMFAMNSDESEMLLQVRRGSAKVRRLADEQVVTVAFNQQVRANRESDEPMKVEPVSVPLKWSASPTKNKNTTTYGTWGEDNVLKAGAHQVYLKARDQEVTHYHAGARDAVAGLVKLTKDSVIKIRYRVNRRINVGLFISTRSESWDFTGNFQAYAVTEKLPADEEGWRTATIPVSTLIPVANAKRTFQPDCIAANIYATTYGDDVGLEVAELSVMEK